MYYATRMPSPPLDRFIQRLWFYAGLDVPYERERVLPDGTLHLMINLGSEPRTKFDRDRPQSGQDFKRAWISGAHSGYILIDTRRGSSLIGVHFKPGGITPFLPVPALELRDQVVELEQLLGSLVSELRDALIEAPTPEAKFDRLERFLTERARGRFEHSPLVAHALRQFMRAPHLLSIDTVAHELGVSHKHLIARFTAEVGLTPKRFCRLQRFQRVITQIGHRQAVDWADLACACGYYDQAHFINEFSDFCGLNPTAYLRRRGEYLNYLPESPAEAHSR